MMNRQPLVVGNWKNGLGVADSVRLAQSLVGELAGGVRSEIVVAPSLLSLVAVVEALGDSSIAVGAQTIGTNDVCTGEVSAEAVADAGVTYVIIGHSERRMMAAEDDDDVAAKVVEATRNDLIPIICVGETKSERKANRTKAVLRRQLKQVLAKMKSDSALVIAYEPVWAIGAKKPASVKIIREAHEAIRGMLGRSARIIYGGSINQESAPLIAAEPSVDGFLVGRASLDAAAFHAIIQAYERV